MDFPAETGIIRTIGHSTRTLAEFISLLHSYKINFVADVRRFPGSRKYPQFNKESLEASLKEQDIGYRHLLSLGGRRKPVEGSANSSWRHPSFRGYADYMETKEFEEGIHELENIGFIYNTVYMCSEALWWRCHRSMISDYLKVRGWVVKHIMSTNVEKDHTFTAPARIVEGKLIYGSAAP